MELFKTTGVLDEMVLKEVAKKGILKSEKGAAISCFLLCLVFSAAGYSALAAVFFSFGLFLVLWQLFLFKRITIKNNLCVMQEFNGVTEYQYTTWFDEEGVVVLNLTSHAEGKLRYTSLKRIFETDHIFVLQTKNKQFVPIFKSGLSAAEVEELTVFLKPQNKKIKIDRLKKCNQRECEKGEPFDSDVSKEYMRLYEAGCLSAEELDNIRCSGLASR